MERKILATEQETPQLKSSSLTDIIKNISVVENSNQKTCLLKHYQGVKYNFLHNKAKSLIQSLNTVNTDYFYSQRFFSWVVDGSSKKLSETIYCTSDGVDISIVSSPDNDLIANYNFSPGSNRAKVFGDLGLLDYGLNLCSISCDGILNSGSNNIVLSDSICDLNEIQIEGFNSRFD
jgi:hypothetical protein